MDGMKKAGIELDRKVLADLAVREPEAFKATWSSRRRAPWSRPPEAASVGCQVRLNRGCPPDGPFVLNGPICFKRTHSDDAIQSNPYARTSRGA